MVQSQHDTIAYRLSQVLIKLNQGDHLDPVELADEFGTHVRTIQRDLKIRLAHLPLLKTRGRYHLEPAYLGKLSFKDIERFATLAGVKGLFPSLNRDFLRDFFGGQDQVPWLVRGHNYEDLSRQSALFGQLEDSVIHSQVVSLDMLKDGHLKTYLDVQPYRLINTKGIWYLAAVHDGKLKTFGIGKIRSVNVLTKSFARNASIEASIQAEDGIWQSPQKLKVILSIAPEAAEFFKRRQLIPNQKVISESESGVLTVEATVGHPNQILPIVRYWIPSIKILSPEDWNNTLATQLSEYLNRLESAGCSTSFTLL